MKAKTRKSKPTDLAAENAALRARLAEAEETLEAIRSGAVDALVVSGAEGDQIFALKSAETPYRLLVEAMHEAALMLNAEGVVLYCNGRLATMAQCPLGYPMGKPLAEFVAPEQAGKLNQLLTAVPAEGRKGEFWLQSPEHGGHPIPVQLAIRSLEVEGSRALAVVATDLTTQKAYEGMLHQSKEELEERVRLRTTELRDQREYFRVTLNSIGDAVIAFDTSGRTAFLNPIAVALTGWPEEQALGQPAAEVFKVIDEKTRQHGEDIVARALQQKRVIALANGMVLMTRNGREIPIEDSAAPIFDASGKVTGVVLVFHEVTEKRRAQEALRASELEQRRQREFLECVIANAGSCIAVVNGHELRYTMANPAFQAFAGSTPMIGRTYREVFPEAAEAGAEALVRRVLETGEPWRVEDYRAPVPGKPDATWQGLVVRLPAAAGDEPSALMVVWDITERIRTEQALRKAKEELAQANADLEQRVQQRTLKLQDMVEELEHFSYTITHDMRAPLRAMQGFASLMEEVCGECLKTDNREYLTLIKRSAVRMDRLITDALQFNKVGKQEMSLGPVDAGELLRGIIQSYPSMQPPKALIQIEGEIPMLLGNEGGLTQCFANLLGNAVKFVPPGTVPKVRVFAENREGFVRLWFEDNGIGIPKVAHDKLFRMFQRATKQFEGTGIGLALARKVTERMGGRIGMESTPGKGSRFWVDLKPAT